MNEIREIVTKAVIAKGKKTIKLKSVVSPSNDTFSILGCWVINHGFTATLDQDCVVINGEFEINIWYSTNGNTKTDILREVVTYKKEIETKRIIKDYLENSDDVLARIIQHPTCTNARIFDDSVEVDITFEILAEIIGETKMKVTVFREENTWEDDVEALDMDLNENFLEN